MIVLFFISQFLDIFFININQLYKKFNLVYFIHSSANIIKLILKHLFNIYYQVIHFTN